MAAALLEDLNETAVLVTAGHRLARALRLEHAERARAAGREVWHTPEILPWAAWIESLWDAALYAGLSLPVRLDGDQERLVWRRILDESPEAGELLDLPATAEAAQRCWELIHSWRLEFRAIEERAGDDTRAFLSWARRFQQLSEVEGWVEPVRRSDRLIPELADLPLPRTLFVAGFDEFTPQQRCFLEACEGAGVEIRIQPACAEACGESVRAGFPDRARELEAAARWARGLLERGEARSIGVVIPNLEAARSQVECIFTRVFDPAALLPHRPRRRTSFNISAAPALWRQPLIRAALLALELHRHRNPIGRISALLRSSFLAGADSERSQRALLDRQLRAWGVTEISVRRLRRLCREQDRGCPKLRRALRVWSHLDRTLPARQRPSDWSRDFSRLLKALGWPGERPLSSEEFQAVGAWKDVLGRLARLDVVSGHIERDTALAELRDLAASTPHQPESEAAPVQILGVLETPGLRFDALWIAGLDDENWPRPARPEPFLPLALQRERGLPHASAERELEFARRQTQRLLASAGRIVASWPRQDGDRVLGPSPLIRDWPEAAPEDLGLSCCPDFVRIVRASGQVESFEDARGPALSEGTWQHGGTRVFQYQALCPFRAFAELRLGAEPSPFPEPGLSAMERGTAVHAALEYLWRTLRTHRRLCEIGECELALLLAEASREALRRIEQARGELPPRFADLERGRLERLLRRWLELERGRPFFEVLELEGLHEVELAGIRARVRVDRIDRLEDGRDLILDYKTGRCSAADWEGERPSEPQLPLYAVSHHAPLAGISFARIKTGDMCFIGLASGCEPAPGIRPDDLKQRLAEWRAALEELGRRFREGRAEVDPKRDACRLCGLQPLCRVYEAERIPAEGNGGAEDS